jgi:hypothetical protein
LEFLNEGAVTNLPSDSEDKRREMLVGVGIDVMLGKNFVVGSEQRRDR